MSLDEFKKFGMNSEYHSESKIKRFRSALKLLEQDGVNSMAHVYRFTEEIDQKNKSEEISNILNTRFGTKYAHSTARDLFNCLKSVLEQHGSENQTHKISALIPQEHENIDISEVISLANELSKNQNNPNLDSDLRADINKLILKKMQNTISKII